jgi:cyclopropane-fatty-acyl-phospholipid synthase
VGVIMPLQPFFRQVQAHYDLSNEFFALFLDPSLTYSCAFFARDDMSLAEAQQAKIDLALGKCDLHPGQRLLDIGCGWGATLRRAVENYGAQAVGLTLSERQHQLARARLADLGDRVEVRLQGWEEFDEPVDRIVSIGAFEHFREERYAAFFETCRRILTPGGRLLLHTIVWLDPEVLAERGLEVGFEDVQFLKFIGRKIFPGGQLRSPAVIQRYAKAAGFNVTQVQALRPHYARTLDCWAANLQAARERAIELTSAEVYDTYLHYLTGCARYFRDGYLDVVQFTCCLN